MPRKGWSAAPLEWVHIVRGRQPKSEQWPLAPGHSQYRTAQGSQQHKIGSGVKRVSTPRLAEHPAGAVVVRERKTPEQARSEASTRVSRLQAALSSLGDGDAAEKRALEVALAKAQKQAEEMPVARQIEVTKEFILLQTRKSDWLKFLCRTLWTKRSTICSKSLWPKHASSASRRRLSRLIRPHPLCPIWKPRFRGCEPNWPGAGCECGPSPTSKFSPSSRHDEGEGCKTACGSFRAHPNRPARPRVLFVGKAFKVVMRSNLEIKSPSSL